MPTDTYEPRFSQTPFSAEDIARIMTCRGEHNRLGFAYQLAFVRSLNRFPAQDPLEIDEDVLTFASLQLRMDIQNGWQYGGRQKTVSEHQDAIRGYLDLRSFSNATAEIEDFLFKEACQLEQMAALNTRLKAFLRTHHILYRHGKRLWPDRRAPEKKRPCPEYGMDRRAVGPHGAFLCLTGKRARHRLHGTQTPERVHWEKPLLPRQP